MLLRWAGGALVAAAGLHAINLLVTRELTGRWTLSPVGVLITLVLLALAAAGGATFSGPSRGVWASGVDANAPQGYSSSIDAPMLVQQEETLRRTHGHGQRLYLQYTGTLFLALTGLIYLAIWLALS
jgi:hypothetical protein